jgi:hypothetical protein
MGDDARGVAPQIDQRNSKYMTRMAAGALDQLFEQQRLMMLRIGFW